MKTLVIVTHPDIENSVVNQAWLKELARYPEQYTLHLLHQAYPDGQIDVAAEQALLEAHQNVVFQFPVYWFSSPPLLKKWQDDVLTYGWAYGAESGYNMQGKQVALAVSAGIKEEDYRTEGRYRYSLEEIFRPFEVTINYVKADYRSFFGFYGTETPENLNAEALHHSAQQYRAFIDGLSRHPL